MPPEFSGRLQDGPGARDGSTTSIKTDAWDGCKRSALHDNHYDRFPFEQGQIPEDSNFWRMNMHVTSSGGDCVRRAPWKRAKSFPVNDS